MPARVQTAAAKTFLVVVVVVVVECAHQTPNYLRQASPTPDWGKYIVFYVVFL